MHANSRLISRLKTSEHRVLLLPATLAGMYVAFSVLLASLTDPLHVPDQPLPLFYGLAGLGYLLFAFFVLVPLISRYPWIIWLVSFANAFGAAALAALVPEGFAPVATTLLVAILLVSASLAGRWATYFFISLYTLLNLIWNRPHPEAGSWAWASFISLVVLSVMILETILRFEKVLERQLRRLELINAISQKMSSTIEPEGAIDLLNQSIRDTGLADSYFVGLVKAGKLRLELFYDDGEFYPPTEMDAEGSLSGWIINNRHSLLLRNVPEDARKLGIPYQPVGKPKSSLSWMGTPMEAGGKIIGVVAMASYRKSAFDEADLEMLKNIAHQAALVIDNAYHHAEVEEQSRRDSLTQVYNHGHFLVLLNEFVAYSSERQTATGLIMLDIDHFKLFNDQYGHQVGDQALRLVVQAIRQHLRSTDLIGRWGGEEFAILLPNTSGKHANQVAERIRQSLAGLNLDVGEGMHIPAPTVSQGVAVFPMEANSASGLIHLADRRLYQAKARGRDQVEPAPHTSD